MTTPLVPMRGVLPGPPLRSITKLPPTTMRPPAPADARDLICVARSGLRLADPMHVSTAAALAAPQSAKVTPAWFILGPGEAALPEPQRIIEILAHGRPFAPDVAARLHEMCKVPVSRGGLEKLFARLLPAATWLISDANVEGRGVSFEVAALARTGRVLFEVGVAICDHPDGALEMHTYSADVDPQLRGLGITAQGEILQEAIIRALSQHPDTRLTLAAGYQHDANTGLPQPSNGALLHAMRGYLFADSLVKKSPFAGYPPSPLQDAAGSLDDTALCAKHFVAWARGARITHKEGHAPTPLQHQALVDAANACKQPVDFLSLGGETWLAPALGPDGNTRPMGVGRAFLLSGEAPVWCGVRFVHAAVASAPTQLKQVRASSRAMFEMQLRHEIKSAANRQSALRDDTFAQFTSHDAAARASAYKTIGLLGTRAMHRCLRNRLEPGTLPHLPPVKHPPVERNAMAHAALVEALNLFNPMTLRLGLQEAANDTQRPENIRSDMRLRLRSLDER